MKQYKGGFLSTSKWRVPRRGVILGGILLLALLAFEIFNYSTTDFALTDLLGPNLRFAGFSWATILSLAFCGIDFAGLARLFTPELARSEPEETWYLFGAWMLAAGMNVTLTWWGVAVAVRTHIPQADGVVLSQRTLLVVIPIFVAVMVGIIRVLIIGTFAKAGSRIFNLTDGLRQSAPARPIGPHLTAQDGRNQGLPHPASQTPIPIHPAPRPEPGYHPVGMAARPPDGNGTIRK